MPESTSTANITFSRNELLQLNSRTLPLSRKTRKSIFNSKLWCPSRQRLAIIKPRIFATSNGTKCGLLNARSVNKKEASISALITDCDLDFLFLTETWCHGNSSVSQERLKPRGYDAKFCNRDGKGGGGVGCVFRHSATVKPIPSKKCSSFDHLVLKIQFLKETLKVIIIYKPDGVYSTTFHAEFTELLTIQFARDNFKPLILGDLNFHVNTPDDILEEIP